MVGVVGSSPIAPTNLSSSYNAATSSAGSVGTFLGTPSSFSTAARAVAGARRDVRVALRATWVQPRHAARTLAPNASVLNRRLTQPGLQCIRRLPRYLERKCRNQEIGNGGSARSTGPGADPFYSWNAISYGSRLKQ